MEKGYGIILMPAEKGAMPAKFGEEGFFFIDCQFTHHRHSEFCFDSHQQRLLDNRQRLFNKLILNNIKNLSMKKSVLYDVNSKQFYGISKDPVTGGDGPPFWSEKSEDAYVFDSEDQALSHMQVNNLIEEEDRDIQVANFSGIGSEEVLDEDGPEDGRI